MQILKLAKYIDMKTLNAIKKSPLLLILICSFILLYWAFYNGFPLVFSDTGSYIISGFENKIPNDRPIYYGLFIRHISLATSLWYVVFAQSIILSFLIYKLVKELSAKTNFKLHYVFIIFFLTLTTGISFNVSMLLPDFFTSISILTLIIILFAKIQKNFSYVITCIIYVYAIFTHNTHIQILTITIFILSIIWLIKKIKSHELPFSYKRLIFIWSLHLFTFISFPTCNYFFSKKFFYTEAAPIFFISKLSNYGILSDYLNKNCETKNYKICQYKDNLPWDFLWDENSPLYKTGGWENENNKKEYTEIIKDIFSKPKYVKIFIVKTINSTLNIFFKFETGDTQLGVDQLRSPEGAINWHFKNELRDFWSSKQCNKILNFDEINNRQNIIIYTSFLVLILAISAISSAFMRG